MPLSTWCPILWRRGHKQAFWRMSEKKLDNHIVFWNSPRHTYALKLSMLLQSSHWYMLSKRWKTNKMHSLSLHFTTPSLKVLINVNYLSWRLFLPHVWLFIQANPQCSTVFGASKSGISNQFHYIDVTIKFLTHQQFCIIRKMKYKCKLLLLQHIILPNTLIDNPKHDWNLLEMMQRKHVFQKVWCLTCGASTWIKVQRSPKTHVLVKNLSHVFMVVGPQALV